MANEIAVNSRILTHATVGVVRYTRELSKRLSDRLYPIAPGQWTKGAKGHAWEQFCLPGSLGGRLLWSPSNTGPLAVPHQVVTIHDLSTLDHPEWSGRAFASWYRWLLPRLVRRVSHVIAVSNFTKQRLVARCGVPEDRVTVIRNGIDDCFRRASSEAVDEVVGRLAIPSGRYFLSLCTLEPRKNLGRLLDAWRLALPSLPDDVCLVLAGGKGDRRVFRDAGLGELPDRVHLTGYVAEQDLPALYSGALAHIYVSLYEGFGLPPLEAMACGCPVVVSNLASLPEVCGDAGYLVDPLDVNAIAEAVAKLTVDDTRRNRMRSLGDAQVTRFSWDRTAEETWNVLSAAAGIGVTP